MNGRRINEKRDDEVRLSADVCAEKGKVKLLGSASNKSLQILFVGNINLAGEVTLHCQYRKFY